jgi:hypothetical protein
LDSSLILGEFFYYQLLTLFNYLVGVVSFLLEHAHENPNLVHNNPLVESLVYFTHDQGLIQCDSIWFLSLLCVKINSIFLPPLFLLQLTSVVFPTHY